MRKRVVPEHPQGALADEDWLHVEGLAEVEVTSEALAYPVEGAFFSEPSAGWRASGPGPQTIKLHFQPPQQLTRIALYFVESEMERTQEYTLRWSHGYGESFHEIVRQLRGEADDRQVPGSPKVGFTQLYGAPGTAAATILTT